MRTRATLALAAALVGCLAGCADADPPTPRLEELELDAIEPETTSELGGLRGAVVDAAIRPIGGATVEVQGGGGSAVTDEQGLFAVDRLEPGTHFVEVTATGFQASRVVAEVSAGAVTDLRILLKADPRPVPFRQTVKFDGHIDASVPLAAYITDIVLTEVLNQSLCRCLQHLWTEDNVTTMVFEMAWTPATPGPTSEDLYFQFFRADGCDGGLNIQSDFHESPIVEHYDRKGLWGSCTAFKVHYGGSAFGPNVNQPFTSFTTLWSNGAAPDGWSLVRGDT